MKNVIAEERIEMPNSRNIECQLLSELIMAPENIPIAEGIIDKSAFSVEDYGELWCILVDMRRTGEVIDLTTISARIKRETLMELIQPQNGMPSGSVFSIMGHCNALRNFATRREILADAWNMVQYATNNSVDIAELMAMPGRLAERIQDMTVKNASTKSITEVFNELCENIEAEQRSIEEGRKTRIPTGFENLDYLTYSGFYPGNLVILAARPSVGKTSIMLQMAKAAGNAGFAATIYSLEMTSIELTQKILFSTGLVTPGQLAGGSIDWVNIERANGAIGNVKIFLNDSARTIDELTTDIVANHSRGRCDIAFIDYLGLIQGVNPKKPLYQAIGEITGKLKHLAKTCGIPIVLLCQLNRELESCNRSPELYDLRDSGSIEQDADIVLMAERETRDLNDPNVNIWVRKNRHGKAGNLCIKLVANASFTEFAQR